MNKYHFLPIIFLSILALAFKPAVDKNNLSNKLSTAAPADTIGTLTIEGDNIWVRDTPATGDVVMKLNSGDKCINLEKGPSQTIRGIEDYWYKISCNNKTGWVFGSQTSIRQGSAEEYSDFIYRFASNYIIMDDEAECMRPFISPIHGLNMDYMNCPIKGGPKGVKHYSKKGNLAEPFMRIANANVDISNLDYNENDIYLKEMIANKEVKKSFYDFELITYTLTFKQIEGKWFLRHIEEFDCPGTKSYSGGTDDFEMFMDEFLHTTFFHQNIDSLLQYMALPVLQFLNMDIGFYRFYNPGAMCVPYGYDNNEEYYGYKFTEIKPLKYYSNQLPKGGFVKMPQVLTEFTT